ncbi:MAG: hypothetical protein JWQ35_565 [Bacteriovoracaceae bacterium]|nr:hypothetical protein [Bacteriovoracaceae bacterium]
MSKNCTIALLGDVMLGRLINDVLSHEPPEFPWGNTLSILKKADFRICNLECAITDFTLPWTETYKVFHFRTDTKNIAALDIADINLVSLANNHILDFRLWGMAETLKTLAVADISFAGAGMNIEEASMPVIFKINDLKFGFIAFTDNEPEWEATKTKAGLLFAVVDLEDERAKFLLKKIEEAKKAVDFLIVSAHWGPNWSYFPPPEQIPFAHALIDAGADLIFGHSAHVFRGIEFYRDRPILYSCGDFIDDYAVDPDQRNDESFIFLLQIENGKTKSLQLIPTVIETFQAKLPEKEERFVIVNKMKELCAHFGTSAEWNSEKLVLEVRSHGSKG